MAQNQVHKCDHVDDAAAVVVVSNDDCCCFLLRSLFFPPFYPHIINLLESYMNTTNHTYEQLYKEKQSDDASENLDKWSFCFHSN